MKLSTAYIPFTQHFACLILLSTWFASLFFHGNYDFLYGFLIVGFWISVAFFQAYSFSSDSFVQFKKPIPIAFIIFIVLCVLNSVTSSVPYTSIYFAYIFLMCPVLFLIFIHHEFASHILSKVIFLIVMILIGVAFWAIFQFLFLQDTMGSRIHHPMVNPNSLAALFNVGIILIFGMVLCFKNVLIRTLLFLSIIFLLFALITTQSKGGMFTLVICLCGLFASCYPIWKTTLVRLRIYILSFAIIVLSLPVIFLCASDFQWGSFKTRVSLWSAGFEMFKDHPWFGIGYSTFYLHYPSYRYDSDVYSAGFFTHMDSLQFAIEFGVLAPILFYLIAFCFILRTCRVFQLGHLSELRSTKILSLFWALASMFFHSHLSFHFYLMPILILSGLLLAFLYVETSCKDVSKKVTAS